MSQPSNKNGLGYDSTNFLRTDHLKTDLGKHSIRGGIVTIIAQAFKFGLALASNLFLARLLNPEAYGLIGMVTAVTGFVSLFKDLGLSMATIQKEELTQNQVSNLFWINTLVSVASTLITILIAPAIAEFYHEPRLIWISIALSIGFVISGLGVQHAALLTRQMKYKALMVSDVVSQFLGIITATILAWQGAGYWSLVSLPLITASANTMGIWSACKWRPNVPTWKSGTKSLLTFGGNIAGFSILGYFALNLDNILIGKFWGTQQLGMYAKAYQLLLLPISQVTIPITNVIVPLLSRLKDSPERYRQIYLRTLETILIITTPIILFMVMASDILIPLLLGSQWEKVTPIFIMLGLSGLFRPVMNSTGWLFISQDRTFDLLKWGMISSAIIVLSFVIGLPWGAIGVATAYSATLILVVMPSLFWFVGQKGPVQTKDFYITMMPIVLATVLTSIVLQMYHYWIHLSPAYYNCVMFFGLTIICFYGILFSIPISRRIFHNTKELVLLIKATKI